MIKEIRQTWNYSIADPNADLQLTIQVAAPQSGESSFENFDGEVVSSPVNGKRLGKGADLKGQELYVNSTVTDIDSASNLTKVTYTINGVSKTFQDTVDEDNDTISYNITIKFS